MIAAMDERGVSVFLGDGIVVYPDLDVREYERHLDVMAELGTAQVNTVSFDPDLARSVAGFARIADMAAARGMSTTVEFAPSLTLTTLDAALDAVRQVGRPDFGLLIDTALAGESTEDSARRCVQGARALLATLGEGPTRPPEVSRSAAR
jgi:sugar phosphate isomerase/epimerase